MDPNERASCADLLEHQYFESLRSATEYNRQAEELQQQRREREQRKREHAEKNQSRLVRGGYVPLYL